MADLRAATPSAAAEIITEGVFSSDNSLAEAGARVRELAGRQLEDKEAAWMRLYQRLLRTHPRRRLNEWLQRLDDLQEGLSRFARQATRERRLAWRNLRERLRRVRPGVIVAQRRESLDSRRRGSGNKPGLQLEDKQTRLAALEGRLRLLGPEQVLARGYSITMNADTGRVIRTAAEVKAGQKLRTRLKSGEVRSVARD